MACFLLIISSMIKITPWKLIKKNLRDHQVIWRLFHQKVLRDLDKSPSTIIPPYISISICFCLWSIYRMHNMFFFHKHNAYKHIQPGIKEKNNILSIFCQLENSCFHFLSCLKSHVEACSEPCQTSKMKLLPKTVHNFLAVKLFYKKLRLRYLTGF